MTALQSWSRPSRSSSARSSSRADPAGADRRRRGDHRRCRVLRRGRGDAGPDVAGLSDQRCRPARAAAARGRAAPRPPHRLRRHHRPDRRHGHGHGRVRARRVGGGAARYDAGLMGSRRLMAWEMDLSARTPTRCSRPRPPSRTIPGSRPSSGARSGGHPGRGRVGRVRLLHRPALQALGVPELPVVTARRPSGGRPANDRVPERPPGAASSAAPASGPASWPIGRRAGGRLHRRRRERSLRRRLQRRRVRQAPARAPVPGGRLAVPALDRVREIETWLAATIEAWRADPASSPPAGRCPAARGFFCGPQAGARASSITAGNVAAARALIPRLGSVARRVAERRRPV